MREMGFTTWAALFVTFGLAATAEAGSIVSASGPIEINGTQVTVDPAKPIALKQNDNVDTLQSTATFRSDAGDEIALEPGTAARHEGVDKESEYLFLRWGSATGLLSARTSLGAAASWARPSAGTKSRVFVEAPKGKSAVEAYFRAIEGGVDLHYQSFRTVLPAAHSVTLDIDPNLPGSMCFRTSQQNAGDVEIRRMTPGGEIHTFVPKASAGCITDADGNKTKICNDPLSLKTAKIRIETRFVGKEKFNAAIGPGTCALVDNATGKISVVFAAVEFEILDRAISLTTEFSTLAQSNFSDVE